MWDGKYPFISQSWSRHWLNLITLFDYPDDIRKAIYTTNAIESVNTVIRKVLKNRRVFPHDQTAMKVVYLAIDAAAKKWTMPIWNWKGALNRFMIEFPERMRRLCRRAVTQNHIQPLEKIWETENRMINGFLDITFWPIGSIVFQNEQR